MASIDNLPEEILEFILYLISPYEDLRSCRQVCQRWYTSCQHVVAKRKLRFVAALRSGYIEWMTPHYPSHIIPITRRYSHSAAIYDTAMYVFGGCTATNTTFNDLWRFDLGVHEWTRLLTTGTYPSPKAHASFVKWKNYLVLFGGWTHPSLYPLHQQWVLYSELHIYDIIANRWTALYCQGSPPPTAGHTATVHRDVMVVVGGLQKQEGTSSSTSDVFCLDLVRQAWFKPIVSLNGPQPRYGHSQIKIDDSRLIIMAGCGGSNKLYNDVWMLVFPYNVHDRSAEWKWAQVSVEGTENIPSQLWYNPACKVGNNVIVLSTASCANNARVGGNMSQILVPGIVRRQPANVWVPPVQQLPEVRPLDRAHPEHQRPEPNVNGQRGFLRPGARVVDWDSSSDESEDNSSHRGCARSRTRPSIRPNASSDRERRLQILSRMEDRLRALARPQENPGNRGNNDDLMGNDKNKQLRVPSKNFVVPHTMDLSKVVSLNIVRWLPVNVGDDGIPLYVGYAPQSWLLYSLLYGRGHLIMFGGIPKDPSGTGHNQDTVSNTVTFISAPTSYCTF